MTHPWTFVSCFLNLDSFQAGNPNCRPARGYLEKAISTLELPAPICVFVSADMYEIVLEKAKHRTYPTEIIPLEFADFHVFKFFEKVFENRTKGIYKEMYANSRNTPAYFLTNVAKWECLRKAVERNPFGSSIYAWIDFHYGHCDPNFSLDELKDHISELVSYPLRYLPNVYMLPLISWLPTSHYHNKSLYYTTHMRTTFAGGFHYGPANLIPQISEAILKEFEETVEQGYGHADEQLVYYVYRHHPEWFDVFPCDYYKMVFNALYPRYDIGCTLRHLLPGLLADNQTKLLRSVISKLIQSHTKGLIQLDQGFFNTYSQF